MMLFGFCLMGELVLHMPIDHLSKAGLDNYSSYEGKQLFFGFMLASTGDEALQKQALPRRKIFSLTGDPY